MNTEIEPTNLADMYVLMDKSDVIYTFSLEMKSDVIFHSSRNEYKN